MFSITIEAGSLKELGDKIASFNLKYNGVGIVPADIVHTKKSQHQEKKERKEKQNAPAEDVVHAPITPAPEAPDEVEEKIEAKSAVTKDDVIAVLQKVTALKDGTTKARILLAKYNSLRIRDLKDTDFAGVVKEGNDLLISTKDLA